MKKIAGWIVDGRVFIFIVTIILVAASIFGMSQVNINYDMSKYLPNDSAVREGMKLMEQEYGEMAAVTVMFENLSPKEQTEHKEQMEKIEYVKNVIYLQQDENYQKGNYSKYILNISAGTYSKEAREVLKTLRNTYEDKALISGVAVDNDLMIKTLTEEIPVIAAVAVIIIFAILFLLCDSWIEPFLYMGCIGAAVLMNMGSNAWLPSVSFMTFAIGSLLQMGLSMDYSIMLMNRYGQEKGQEDNPAAAMKKALANSFLSISSSSLTTIAGLLVLLMMSFKIGQDMGIVLAKGVFISLLCIFIILPGLVVQCDRLMDKTRKRSLQLNMKPVMKFVSKIRFISVPLILLITTGAYIVKDNLEITYIKTLENSAQTKTEEIFGVDNQCVFLYDSAETKESIEEYIDWLEGFEEVNYVQDYLNTAGKAFTYTELAKEMEMPQTQAEIMYQMYQEHNDPSAFAKITMYDLISDLNEQIADRPDFEQFMDKEQLKQLTDAKQELEDGKKELEKAKKEIAAGEKKLAAGEKEVSKGEQQLADAKKELADGERQVAENEQLIRENEEQIREGENELAAGEQQVKEGEQQLAAAENELVTGEKQVKKGEQQLAAAESELADAEKQIKEGEQQLSAAKQQMADNGMTEDLIAQMLVEKETELKAAKQQLKEGKKELKQKKAEFAAIKKSVTAGRKELNAKKAELAEAKKELESGRQELEQGKRQLEAGKAQLLAAKKKLETGKAAAAEAEAELESGRRELERGKKELEEGRQAYQDGRRIYEKKMDEEELSEIMEQEVSEVKDLLKIHRILTRNVDKDKVTLGEFLAFLADDVLTDQNYANAVDEDLRKEILDGKTQLEESCELMQGKNYNRMMISTKLLVEGEDTFRCINEFAQKAEDTFKQDTWLVGDAAMGCEMNAGFTDELNFVTLMTVIVVFAVVFFTFRSVISSAVLVAMIQASVFVTTAIVCLQGYQVNYIALILVQCILMGATIDYGILLFDHYKEMRAYMEKMEAVAEAMNRSIKTILTSSLILTGTCLTVSVLMTQEIISQTCLILAYGAICSVILVIFILPAILLLLDRKI